MSPLAQVLALIVYVTAGVALLLVCTAAVVVYDRLAERLRQPARPRPQRAVLPDLDPVGMRWLP